MLGFFDQPFLDGTDRAENVRSFIKLLWRLRVLFDEHIIKWIDQGEEKVHMISSISVTSSDGNRYMNRSRDADSDRAFSLLQSMLYHSQEITTQYWITPLLLFMHRNPGQTAQRYFAYLQHLDNHLLGSSADQSLVVRTMAFMKDPWRCCNLIHEAELAKSSGVKFAHYWFYKLEFVLWYQKKRTTAQWKKFRLTAKSSVEHISSQTPTERDDNRVDHELDHFGNFTLFPEALILNMGIYLTTKSANDF